MRFAQYTGFASRESGGMGVPCSRSKPKRVCGGDLGAATAIEPGSGRFRWARRFSFGHLVAPRRRHCRVPRFPAVVQERPSAG